MKTIITITAFLILGFAAFAQTPQSFNYQAVLRDANGQVLANHDVEIGIVLLQGSATGTEVFSETHLLTTNGFGLANLQIGSENTTGMENIDWSAGPYFIKISVDGSVMGTSQLLSVPYALFAGAVAGGDNDPKNEIQTLAFQNNQLSISSGNSIDLSPVIGMADTSSTNELQDISLSGTELSISQGSTVDLSGLRDGTGTDEQTLKLYNNRTLHISNGNYVTLPYVINEQDGDKTNELQTLSISNDTIYLTDGGKVKLPAETDPEFTTWDKSTGIKITESQITDLKHFTGDDITGNEAAFDGWDKDASDDFTTSDETDPVYAADSSFLKTGIRSWNGSLAKNINQTDTTRWGQDVDPTNELQALSISNDTIYLSNGGKVKLPAETDPKFTSWDKSTGIKITESQITDLDHFTGDSITGNETAFDGWDKDASDDFTTGDETDPVYAADSSFLKTGMRSWNGSLAKNINQADTTRWGQDVDPTNELQALSISNDTIYLSNGGFVKLPAGNAMSLDAAYDNGRAITADAGAFEVNGNSGVLFTGEFGSSDTPPASGTGTRMMWYPAKAAFRAGRVYSTRWDSLNIGNHSVAMGYNTTASEEASTAMGSETTASGETSTAMGYYTTASGNYGSTAMGYWTTASGENSSAIGYGTTASGNVSTAMGYNTTARGIGSTAIGSHIDVYGDRSVGVGLDDTERIVIMDNIMAIMGGDIGIGTVSPSYKLDVDGTGCFTGNCIFYGNIGIGNASPSYKLDVNGAGHFTSGCIVDGDVGIGTTSPDYPLEVNGSHESESHTFAYLQYHSIAALTGKNTATRDYSIVASNKIRAEMFCAISDRRIKTNIQATSGKTDLDLVNKMEVVDYQYIDKIEKGNITKKGFIAQQIEEVLPDAVAQSKAFIPDIYKKATAVVVDSTANTITVSTPVAHNLQEGDMLRFITLGGTHEEKVLSVFSDNTFTVQKPEGDCSEVFVYGKKVDDFRAIDYDQVFSAGIGAIQELSRQNDELKQTIENLQNANTALKAENSEINQRLETLEALVKNSLNTIAYEKASALK